MSQGRLLALLGFLFFKKIKKKRRKE